MAAILLQVHKRTDEEFPLDSSTYLVDLETDRPADPNLPQTNGWYIIRNSLSGPVISEIYSGVSQEVPPIHSRSGTGCAIVGSKLYDIGGRGSIDATRNLVSNQIRYLDTKQPEDGWRRDNLPVYFSNPVTVVSGKFIYLFPKENTPFKVPGQQPWPWALVYDTVERKSLPLNLPEELNRPPSICVSIPKDDGVLLLVSDGSNLKSFVHKTDGWEWEQLYTPKSLSFTHICNNRYAVSDGILYVYRTLYNTIALLDTYDVRTWTFLGAIQLPKFKNLDIQNERNLFIVPTSGDSLCFLWHRKPHYDVEEDKSPLYYAKIEVSLYPAPTARIFKEAVLGIYAVGVINCLPWKMAEENIDMALTEIECLQCAFDELDHLVIEKMRRS